MQQREIPKTKLRDRARHVGRTKHYSYQTQKSYVHFVRYHFPVPTKERWT